MAEAKVRKMTNSKLPSFISLLGMAFAGGRGGVMESRPSKGIKLSGTIDSTYQMVAMKNIAGRTLCKLSGLTNATTQALS